MMMIQAITQASANLRFLRHPRVALALAIAWLGSSFSAAAQQYEYEPDEGLHQEEWYDPSDWFDNEPGIDYERDWWDSWDYPGTYDYRTDYGSDYGWRYDWDPVNGNWRSDYGFYTQQYVGDAAGDYGWHYDWDPKQRQWVEDYGFHTSNYDFDYSKYDYSNENVEQSRAKQQTKSRQELQRASDMAQDHQRGQHVVVGQIDRIHDTDRKELIKLRLENGEMVAVDFGNQETLEQLDLQAGSRVVIKGRQGQINGEDVLFARQVTVNGESHAIEDNQQWRQSRNRNQQQRDQQARAN